MKDLCKWIEFFEAAGVPAKVRETYAGIFVEHRISNTVLADLDKDHLKDMGITVIGDIISILKQCKKIRHELSVTPAPVVTSTTSKECSFEDKKPTPKIPVSRRMNPEVEGKYVVKMPKGTTPKTQKILASLKQKANTKSVQREVSKTTKTIESPVSSTFGDSDADDSDNYRVIISKPSNTNPNSGDSVFNRLGNTINRQESPTSVLIKRTDPLCTVQRLIRWNLSEDSFCPSFRALTSPGDTFSSPEESMDFKVVRQVCTPVSTFPPPIKVKRALKRHASDTVFNRLSSPSTIIQPDNDQLSYKGVLKKSRVQSPKFKNDSVVTNSMKNSPQSYSEGVFGQGYIPKISVKNRLGNRPVKGGASVHSRLGRVSNPI
ncbi:unnamed protein product [Heterobilharzia americana]|nr:unnamed protein product [Heterobilharzia americana]